MAYVSQHALVFTYDNTTININGNNVWDTTVVTPHTSVGDVCTVSHDSHTLPELILFAHTGTTSETHIHASNPTVGAVVLSKGTYKIHVWKDVP